LPSFYPFSWSSEESAVGSVFADVFSGVRETVEGIVALPGRVSEIYRKVVLASSPEGMLELLKENKGTIVEWLDPRSETPGTPFADKNFKNLTVLAETAKRLGVYVLGRVLQYSKVDRSAKTDNLTGYQFNRAFGTFRSWCLFGEEIVDFSNNFLTAFTEQLSIAELENLYGRDNLLYWMNLSSDKMFVNKKGVEGVAKRDMFEGRCWGMSLDFIALYLEQKKSSPELSDFTVVKQIAARFPKGASNRAELAQVCAQVLERKPSLDESSWNTPELSWEEEIIDWLGDADRLLAKGFGFSMGEMISHVGSPSREFFDDLDFGVYSAGFRFNNWESGHAISFIKTEEGKNYIFDPNYGILAVDAKDFSERMKKILDLYGETELIRVNPCR
jgi:hypothetical protein